MMSGETARPASGICSLETIFGVKILPLSITDISLSKDIMPELSLDKIQLNLLLQHQ